MVLQTVLLNSVNLTVHEMYICGRDSDSKKTIECDGRNTLSIQKAVSGWIKEGNSDHGCLPVNYPGRTCLDDL